MTTPRFVTQLVILLIISILIGVVFNAVSNTADTLISNYLAVGQLENDDTGFVFMELYRNLVKPVGSVLIVVIYCCIIITTITVTCKFIKTKIKEGYKE